MESFFKGLPDYICINIFFKEIRQEFRFQTVFNLVYKLLRLALNCLVNSELFIEYGTYFFDLCL